MQKVVGSNPISRLIFLGRGALAEWLRSGLQSRLHRFDSGRRLTVKGLALGTLFAVALLLAGCNTRGWGGWASHDGNGKLDPLGRSAPGAVTCTKVASSTGSDTAAGTVSAPFRTAQQ